MSDSETGCLESLTQKEKELEARMRKIKEREKELKIEKDRKENNKKDKDVKKKQREESLTKKQKELEVRKRKIQKREKELEEQAQENADRLKQQQKLQVGALKDLEERNSSDSSDEEFLNSTSESGQRQKRLKTISVRGSEEEGMDLGYSVPVPMKCDTLIRGMNLTDTQVLHIASKFNIGATDLEEQVVDAIKAFTNTNRELTSVVGKTPKLYDEMKIEDDIDSYIATEEEVFFTEEESEILFLEDNRDTAILDTGCARSTAGEEWIESHIENLSQEDRLDIKEKEGKTYFRFGNGKIFQFKKFLIMPVYFGGKRAMMGMDNYDYRSLSSCVFNDMIGLNYFHSTDKLILKLTHIAPQSNRTGEKFF